MTFCTSNAAWLGPGCVTPVGDTVKANKALHLDGFMLVQQAALSSTYSRFSKLISHCEN